MKQVSEIIQDIEESKKNIEILPTGMSFLDNFLEGGFLKKEFILLGGPTGRGKSLFAGTIFYNIAREGYKCGYFSLEISNNMIVSRLLGAHANISPARIMIKTLEGEEKEQQEKAEAQIETFEEFMFFYDDLYYLHEIVKEIREKKYDFVVIDFIQNVQVDFKGKSMDEKDRLTYIALFLQKLAKEENTCILALSQLSNEVARNKRNKDIVEYKGSGAIGHAADLAFFIEDSGIVGKAELRLRKNRRGIAGEEFNYSIAYPGGGIKEDII